MPQPRIAIKDSARHVSLKDALWFIACGTHKWELEGRVIEKLLIPEPIRELPALREEPQTRRKRSILPPAEVNGCTFKDPQPNSGKGFLLMAARSFVIGKMALSNA